jgi:catechol 2,3-dioxygenase-like lactoylglutathione lyase family enzyme
LSFPFSTAIFCGEPRHKRISVATGAIRKNVLIFDKSKKNMPQTLKHIAIVVDDYDKAIDFYTNKLGFKIIEDTKLSDQKRWVLVAPPQSNCSILLAKATTEEQKSRIGNQTGGRVFLFLNTHNFDQDHKNLINNHVKIVREPIQESYGKVLVFQDLYGNLWDLIQPKTEALFYSTAIIKIKDKNNVSFAVNEIKKFREKTILETGNISFDIQQSINDETLFSIFECFKNENEFNNHLQSKHFQDFVALDIVAIEQAFATKKME